MKVTEQWCDVVGLRVENTSHAAAFTRLKSVQLIACTIGQRCIGVIKGCQHQGRNQCLQNLLGDRMVNTVDLSQYGETADTILEMWVFVNASESM